MSTTQILEPDEILLPDEMSEKSGAADLGYVIPNDLASGEPGPIEDESRIKTDAYFDYEFMPTVNQVFGGYQQRLITTRNAIKEPGDELTKLIDDAEEIFFKLPQVIDTRDYGSANLYLTFNFPQAERREDEVTPRYAYVEEMQKRMIGPGNFIKKVVNERIPGLITSFKEIASQKGARNKKHIIELSTICSDFLTTHAPIFVAGPLIELSTEGVIKGGAIAKPSYPALNSTSRKQLALEADTKG